MKTPTEVLIDQLKRLSSDGLVIHLLGNATTSIIAEAANQLIELKNQRNELLEALEICKEVMEYISEYDIPPTWPAKVKAAIAKAKGE